MHSTVAPSGTERAAHVLQHAEVNEDVALAVLGYEEIRKPRVASNHLTRPVHS